MRNVQGSFATSGGRGLADRVLNAVNAHALEVLSGLYDQNAVLTTPLGLFQGPGRISLYWERLFKGFPDVYVTVWNRVEIADPGFTEWTLTGTHTGPFPLPEGGVVGATGRRIAVRGCGACHAENGLLVAHREYFDLLELYSQLGFSLVLA